MHVLILIVLLLSVVFFRNLISGIFHQAIDQNNITLLIYTQAEPNVTEIALSEANNITEISQFNTSLKTVFYIHGWHETVYADLAIRVREALLSSANVNTIVVNWGWCAANPVYFISYSCVADVGTYIGKFVETMNETYNYSKSDITVVGQSLGAHIAGYIGKITNGSLGVIIGLEPAGPLFYEASTSTRLYDTDAQYIQSVHTDTTFYGVKYGIGHANFWPNGGSFQKDCVIATTCAHNLAVKLYIESILNNTFYARECDSYSNFENGYCSENTKALMAGIDIDTSITGDYYLDTNAASPYGQGDIV